MKKNRGIVSLVLTVVLIALMGFTVLVGFGKTGTGAMKNIKLGLDLKGGVSITYQVKDKNPREPRRTRSRSMILTEMKSENAVMTGTCCTTTATRS